MGRQPLKYTGLFRLVEGNRTPTIDSTGAHRHGLLRAFLLCINGFLYIPGSDPTGQATVLRCVGGQARKPIDDRLASVWRSTHTGTKVETRTRHVTIRVRFKSDGGGVVNCEDFYGKWNVDCVLLKWHCTVLYMIYQHYCTRIQNQWRNEVENGIWLRKYRYELPQYGKFTKVAQ